MKYLAIIALLSLISAQADNSATDTPPAGDSAAADSTGSST